MFSIVHMVEQWMFSKRKVTQWKMGVQRGTMDTLNPPKFDCGFPECMRLLLLG